MIAEKCLEKEREDENKPLAQLLKEILEDLRNLRQRIIVNRQMRHELIEMAF